MPVPLKIKDIATEKTVLTDTDEFVINDVDGGNTDAKVSRGNILSNIKNLKHKLTTTTVALDFADEETQTISISAPTTFTCTGYEASVVKSKVIRIITDATLRTLTFPATWIFVGTKPVDQAASKTGILTISSYGATEADTVAAYAVEA